MNTFSELVEIGQQLPPNKEVEFISERLPGLVALNHFGWWKPGEQVAVKGRRLLIGIALYSKPDLELLDRVANSLKETPTEKTRVEIFNTLDCKEMQDFEKFVPGIGSVFQTPVAGVWENGVLLGKAWGHAGRELIVQILDLPRQ